MEDEDRTVMLSEAETSAAKSPVEQERLTKLLDMAFWHKQVGNNKSAILACEAAIVVNKDSITAHSLLGSLYEKQGDRQKAISHMERVVALNPNNPMEQARLDQMRHDALQDTATSGGLMDMLASRSSSRTSDTRDGESNKLLPILIGVAVVAGVLTIGVYAMHKPAGSMASTSGTAGGTAVQVRPGPGPGFGSTLLTPPVAAATSRMSMGASPTVVAMPKAGVAPFAPAVALAPAATSSSAADPFSVPVPNTTLGLPALKNDGDSHDHTSDKVKILPPISIAAAATAPGDGIVAPAPVTVTDTAGSSVTPLAQHTVVVQQLPNQPASAPSSYQSQAAAPYDPGVVVPHIHITVDKDTGSGATPTSDRNNAIVLGGNSQTGAESADSLQSEALVLQQQGDYAKASQDYIKAIHLYNGQIASGHDVDTARRALRSCQTGLKICQASQ